MKRILIIVVAILTIAITMLSGCIGEKETKAPETTTPVPTTPTPTTPPATSEPGGTVTKTMPPTMTKPPGNLEEGEEKAKKIVLEDERVQDIIENSNYELKILGCKSEFTSEGHKEYYTFLLELENGEKYTIEVNMTKGIVEKIEPVEKLEPVKKNRERVKG